MSELYGKPHLTFAQQVELLVGKGLICSDVLYAEQVLRRVGYYRFAAYVYPFREVLPKELRTTSTQFRSEIVRSGTDIEDVYALMDFDRQLRLLVLDGIEIIEVALRTQVAYVLGRRDKFGHLSADSLGEKANVVPSGHGKSHFEKWSELHRRDIRANEKEDYIAHCQEKYEQIPIWIAIEVMSFGRLSNLFEMLRGEDKNEIAGNVGIAVKGGPLLENWFRSLNHIRNVAAHHSRLWNRTPVYKLKKIRHEQVSGELHHICNSTESRQKIYPALAVMAYLVLAIDPVSNWRHRLWCHLLSAPESIWFEIQKGVGLPSEWASEPLWSAIE